MSFKDIALPLIERGIFVIPVLPGEKRCLLKNWPGQATRGPEMVKFWDMENPAYNVGCVGKLNSIAILDCDVKGLAKRIEKETGQKFPETLVVKSAGKGCLHIYFKHSERSRAIGNRTAPSPEGGEWFSLRADDEYVVGPGSVLKETGKSYDILHDFPICDFPDWLADWINSHSPQAKTFEGELSPVNDDFDIDEMLEHYGITYVQQGNWFNCYQECPVAGYQHQHSKMPGFFFDGNELGFNCWAAGCPSKGMSAGKVIKHLNETHEPYPKLIWPESEVDGFDVEDVVDDEPEIEDPFLPPIKRINPIKLAGKVKVVLKTPAGAAGGATGATGAAAPGAPPAEILDSGSPPTPVVPVEIVEEILSTVEETIGGKLFTYEFTVISADNIPPEEKVWLWDQRIPAHKITLFTGKGDCGKSLVCLEVAAIVSTGRDWPDGAQNTMGPRKVLLLTAEDDPADTVVPRLMAAKADLSMVKILRKLSVSMQKDGVQKRKKRSLQLNSDIAVLQAAMKDNPDYALIVMDPIASYFGDVNINLDKDMRPLMEKLQTMCAATKSALIGILHHNKKIELDSVQKIGGAASIANVCRVIWNFSSDPDCEESFIMAKSKGNIIKRGLGGMKYGIVDATVKLAAGDSTQPVIEWRGKHVMDADQVADRAREVKESGEGTIDGEMGKAIAFLKFKCDHGNPVACRELFSEGEKASISVSTLRRARTKLGIRTIGHAPGPWYWKMDKPSEALPDVKEM